MKYLAITITLFFSGLAAASPAAEKISQEDINNIIQDVDRLYRSNSSYSELEMEIITPNWQRTLSMYGWSEGMDKTFIRITAPKKDEGVATLRIDNEMWNYLPKTDKVIKVPPSMMMSSWMGSDFTNDDLVKEFSLFEDYTYEAIDVEDGTEDNYYINCIPNENIPVVWKNIIFCIRKADKIPRWARYYDEKGRLMRVLIYSDVKRFGDRTIPATLEMIPQNKEGHKTIVRYIEIEFDAKLDRETFTLRNLQSRK
jgi:outer membrane lipoprotein-sorting protein